MDRLPRAITTAHARIDERGDLPYTVRVELRAALLHAGGHVAWARLERAAALYVKDHWTRRFPAEEGPWALLEDAVASLEDGRVLDCADQIRNWWTVMDDAQDEAADHRATAAGYAALAAAASAVFEAERPAGESELDFDPYAWDACFHASVAAAGGATWDEGVGDDSARRAFWEWYLLTAESALQPT